MRKMRNDWFDSFRRDEEQEEVTDSVRKMMKRYDY